jgi:hypothetical protein
MRQRVEEVLREHVAHCVEPTINSGNKSDQRRKIAEPRRAVGRGVVGLLGFATAAH